MLNPAVLAPHRLPFAGRSRKKNTETIDLSIEGANLRSLITREDSSDTTHTVHFWTSSGSMCRSDRTDEGTRWSVRLDPDHRPSVPLWEASARTFADSVLSVIDVLCDQLPADHLPRYPLTRLGKEERAFMRRELPAAFEIGEAARANFGNGIFALAREIVAGRDQDAKIRQEAAWHKRVKKQFELLPSGTILVHRRFFDIAILSDNSGRRTKRSLRQIFSTNFVVSTDLTKQNRGNFCLMSPERAAKLSPGLLSAHQTLQALQQAKELAARCPDLV